MIEPILEPGEEIRDVPNYEGIYAVTSFGRIWSYERVILRNNNIPLTIKGKWLKACKKQHKTDKFMTHFPLSVCLSHPDKYNSVKSVHILVASLFLDNPNNHKSVRCKDGNYSNCNVNNLEYRNQWDEKQINRYKNTISNPEYKSKFSKIMNKKVKCIQTGEIFNSIKEAALFANLSHGSTIARSITKPNYSAGKHPVTGQKLTWEYVDEKLSV